MVEESSGELETRTVELQMTREMSEILLAFTTVGIGMMMGNPPGVILAMQLQAVQRLHFLPENQQDAMIELMQQLHQPFCTGNHENDEDSHVEIVVNPTVTFDLNTGMYL